MRPITHVAGDEPETCNDCRAIVAVCKTVAALRVRVAELEAERDAARADERAKIVAWLRVKSQNWGPPGGSVATTVRRVLALAVDAIEAGEHEPKAEGT